MMTGLEEVTSDAESFEVESSEGSIEEPLLSAAVTEKHPYKDTNENFHGRTCLDFASKLKGRVLARRGMLWGLMAGVTTSFEAILADLADDESPPLQNTFYRSFVLTCAIVFISWKQNSSYTSFDLSFFLLFGIVEFGSTIFTFLAVQYGDIGDVTSIQANLPIPASILGCVLFGEIPLPGHIALLVLNAVGLIIVSKPPFIFGHEISSPRTFEGDGFAAIAVILSAVFQAVARKFAYREVHDSYLLLTVAGLVGLIGSSTLLTAYHDWTQPTDLRTILICLSLGVMSCLTLLGATKGLETESMFTIGILITISIPLTYFYQIIFVGTIPYWYTLVGALLSIVTTVCIYLTSLGVDDSNVE